MLRRFPGRGKSEGDSEAVRAAEGDVAPDQPASVWGRAEQQQGGGFRAARRIRVRWRWLLGILVLLVIALTLNMDLSAWIPAEWLGRWPLVLIGLGAVGLLAGMIASWAPGALGGPLLIALGGVEVLAQQGTPITRMVIGGALLIALGAAVVVRGLTMVRG